MQDVLSHLTIYANFKIILMSLLIFEPNFNESIQNVLPNLIIYVNYKFILMFLFISVPNFNDYYEQNIYIQVILNFLCHNSFLNQNVDIEAVKMALVQRVIQLQSCK